MQRETHSESHRRGQHLISGGASGHSQWIVILNALAGTCTVKDTQQLRWVICRLGTWPGCEEETLTGRFVFSATARGSLQARAGLNPP